MSGFGSEYLLMDLDAIAAEEVAKNPRGGPKCWVCSFPKREWLERKRAEGLSYPVLARILVKAGYSEATFHKVKGHFANGHA